MGKYDILVTGGMCCDMIFSGINSVPVYGTEVWADQLKITVGGVFNVAAASARLGLKVALPGVLGTDMFSHVIRKAMKRENVCGDFITEVDTHHDQVSVVMNYGFERAFLSYAKKHDANSVDNYLKIAQENSFRAYIVCPNSDRRIIDVMRECKKKGAILVMDCFWDEKMLQDEIIFEQMKLADYFLPNAIEACTISGEEVMVKAMEKLAKMTNCLIVKNGSHGVLYYKDGQVRAMDAVHLGEAVDTTGAGDNFVAGFTYGLLNGYPLEKSIRCGMICGAKSVTAISGYENSAYRSEVEELL